MIDQRYCIVIFSGLHTLEPILIVSRKTNFLLCRGGANAVQLEVCRGKKFVHTKISHAITPKKIFHVRIVSISIGEIKISVLKYLFRTPRFYIGNFEPARFTCEYVPIACFLHVKCHVKFSYESTG